MNTFDEEMKHYPEYAEGLAEAEKDIAAGKLKLKAYGKLVPWWTTAADLLKEQYGVEYEVVGWCMTPIEVAANVAAYNERMEQEIASRFGPKAVYSEWRKAEKVHGKRR
ncbi:MAG: hypothetical protein JO112_02480 [Planctomycetes bacterium]|nr:hypothetical protein [Planctomycetota bacterium]